MTTTLVKPIADQIVVRRDEPDNTTPGGIVLPEHAKETPARGRVVAVGSGQLLKDGSRAQMEVNEGDTVVFSSYSGTEVRIDGEDMVVLRENDILFVE